jgi:hypothetical protein
MRQIAIIGRCETSRRLAPSTDPDWECWQLAWDIEPLHRTNRWFEIHHPKTWVNGTLSDWVADDYSTWLNRIAHERDHMLVLAGPYIPGAVVYPLAEVMAMTGMETGYLESSMAYMFAMAAVEKAERVGIWGCDLTEVDEYGYQRPNLAYMIGLFRHQGMKVNVPRTSALWELSALDRLPPPDFMDEKADRFHLEYWLGREVARGRKPEKMRSDLMTSIWKDPPRYGFENLTEHHWYKERHQEVA